MTRISWLMTALLLAAMVRPALAEETPAGGAPADLPPQAAVLRALEAHPSVLAAEARVRAAQAEHVQLKAGNHEYGLRLTGQRRNVTTGPDYNEWEAALERGLRLPGKARLDDQIGARGVEAAEEMVGDARHELGRQLLGLWYAALQSRVEVRLWQEQAALLAKERGIVELRVKRGDAARLDALQADAAQAQAQAQLRQAEARQAAALAELAARFPDLPMNGDTAAEPRLPVGSEADWREHTLDHNHELLVLQRELERLRLMTRRAEADRLPDPAVGLHLAREADGTERVLGLSVSFALPGAARRAQSDVLLGQAEALAEQEAAKRRQLAAEAAVNWQRATAGVDGWQRLKEAATAMARHADLAHRAYELGELGLAEGMLARRGALDAQLSAESARLAANEAIARLLLDAHRLWPLGGDEGHH